MKDRILAIDRAGSVLLILFLVAAPIFADRPVARFDRLDGLAARALAEWRNPGLAMAVVADGKLIYAKGFGVRAPGSADPVDADTVFPIASLTKGFTAAVTGTFVDQGRLDWDEPLVHLLPEFAVADAAVTRELTIRDALAHRSGLADGADWLWLLAGYDRHELLGRLRFITQAAPLRSGESYQNVLPVAVGEGLALRSGESWEALVMSRLIEPLELARTYVSAGMARERAGTNRAVPSMEIEGDRQAVEPEDAAAIAPAAAIHSTARDLACWASLLLAGGELDGKRILAKATVAELLTPQTLQRIGPEYRKLMPETHIVAWGLGWVVQDYRGRLLAWNTGGLAGVSGTIALLPEEKVAVVVLSNDGRTGFPEALAWNAIDLALGAPEKDWIGLRLARSRAAKVRGDAAFEATKKARLVGTSPHLAPAAYCGDWTQDLVGVVAVTCAPEGGPIRLQVGRGERAQLEHWHHDTWLATWERPGYGRSLVTFQLGADGHPERMLLEDVGEFRRAK